MVSLEAGKKLVLSYFLVTEIANVRFHYKWLRLKELIPCPFNTGYPRSHCAVLSFKLLKTKLRLWDSFIFSERLQHSKSCAGYWRHNSEQHRQDTCSRGAARLLDKEMLVNNYCGDAPVTIAAEQTTPQLSSLKQQLFDDVSWALWVRSSVRVWLGISSLSGTQLVDGLVDPHMFGG